MQIIKTTIIVSIVAFDFAFVLCSASKTSTPTLEKNFPKLGSFVQDFQDFSLWLEIFKGCKTTIVLPDSYDDLFFITPDIVQERPLTLLTKAYILYDGPGDNSSVTAIHGRISKEMRGMTCEAYYIGLSWTEETWEQKKYLTTCITLLSNRVFGSPVKYLSIVVGNFHAHLMDNSLGSEGDVYRNNLLEILATSDFYHFIVDVINLSRVSLIELDIDYKKNVSWIHSWEVINYHTLPVHFDLLPMNWNQTRVRNQSDHLSLNLTLGHFVQEIKSALDKIHHRHHRGQTTFRLSEDRVNKLTLRKAKYSLLYEEKNWRKRNLHSDSDLDLTSTLLHLILSHYSNSCLVYFTMEHDPLGLWLIGGEKRLPSLEPDVALLSQSWRPAVSFVPAQVDWFNFISCHSMEATVTYRVFLQPFQDKLWYVILVYIGFVALVVVSSRKLTAQWNWREEMERISYALIQTWSILTEVYYQPPTRYKIRFGIEKEEKQMKQTNGSSDSKKQDEVDEEDIDAIHAAPIITIDAGRDAHHSARNTSGDDIAEEGEQVFQLIMGFWLLAAIVLSNGYKGIVTSNVTAPPSKDYRKTIDDLKRDNFALYTPLTKSMMAKLACGRNEEGCYQLVFRKMLAEREYKPNNMDNFVFGLMLEELNQLEGQLQVLGKYELPLAHYERKEKLYEAYNLLRYPRNFPLTTFEEEVSKCNKTAFLTFESELDNFVLHRTLLQDQNQDLPHHSNALSFGVVRKGDEREGEKRARIEEEAWAFTRGHEKLMEQTLGWSINPGSLDAGHLETFLRKNVESGLYYWLRQFFMYNHVHYRETIGFYNASRGHGTWSVLSMESNMIRGIFQIFSFGLILSTSILLLEMLDYIKKQNIQRALEKVERAIGYLQYYSQF